MDTHEYPWACTRDWNSQALIGRSWISGSESLHVEVRDHEAKTISRNRFKWIPTSATNSHSKSIRSRQARGFKRDSSHLEARGFKRDTSHLEARGFKRDASHLEPRSFKRTFVDMFPEFLDFQKQFTKRKGGGVIEYCLFSPSPPVSISNGFVFQIRCKILHKHWANLKTYTGVYFGKYPSQKRKGVVW